MPSFKKHRMSVAAVIAVVGIFGSFLCLYTKRCNDDLHIEDISGNQSVLNNITIKGMLADSIQQTEFVYKDNRFSKKYSVQRNTEIKLYDYNRKPVNQKIKLIKSFLIPDDADQKVSSITENGRTIQQISANKAIVTLEVNGYTIKTDITVKAEDYSITVQNQIEGNGIGEKSYNLNNKDEGILYPNINPVVTVGNKLYAYTVTGKDCSGFGGAYDISEKGSGESQPNNLAPVDLKDGAVRIVGMEASEDWLVYICVENSKIILKPFSLNQKAFTDDIQVAPLPQGVATPYTNRIQNVFYNAGIQDSGIFNLELQTGETSGDASGKHSEFYSVDLGTKKILLSCKEAATGKNSLPYLPKETAMRYKDGILYTLCIYTKADCLPQITNSVPENCVRISAYRNNESIYQGDIVSDAKEDFQYQVSQLYSSYGNEVRGYYYMEIF